MRKPVMLNLSEEELVMLVGILGYSSGTTLQEVYMGLVDELTHEQLVMADEVARQIAITANGYYIKEEDLLMTVFRAKY